MKKKLLIVCCVCLFVIVIVFCLYNVLFSKKLLFTIQDTSCNCIPNIVYFYSNNTYITKGVNDKFIEEGTYSYDIDLLIEDIKLNSLYDEEENYYVSHDAEYLKGFLSSLEITWY